MKINKKKDIPLSEPLSEAELNLLKVSQEGKIDRSTLPPHDTSDLANAKRFVKKNKFSVLFTILTIVLLVAIVAVLGATLYQAIKNMPSKADYTVALGDTEKYTVPYKSANIDGVFYLDMRKIAIYTDLITSGGNGRMKFTCRDENQTYVRFEDGATTATVNGVRVTLGGTAKITDTNGNVEGECLVPFTFIQKLFSYPTVEDNSGVRIRFSDRDNTIIIRRVTYESGDFLPISFSDECFDSAEDIQIAVNENIYPEAAYVKYTLLVNKSNPLDASYSPNGLVCLNDLGCPTVDGRRFELIPNAATSLTAMLSTLEAELGKSEQVLVTSTYRSYERQAYLFELYVKQLTDTGMSYEQAEIEVLKTTARAGYSEHQTGLCVDLIEPDSLELTERFEHCAAFKWLVQNAYRYGFILRYPKDKVDITGYNYEPWHFRFVGVDAATIIYEDNLCLEEYLASY